MTTDLKKEVEGYTAPRGRFQLVTVPPLSFLALDGHGDPNTSAQYQDSLTTIYPVAYALKFLSARQLGRDHVVMPLEALWWSDDVDAFTSARDKTRWSWTVLIMVPAWITAEHLEEARRTVAARKGAPRLDELRLEPLEEGLSVQTLHVGRYDDEGPVLEAMHHQFVPAEGLRLRGRHHEIYLSDARRTAPEKLRTILRQPVTRDDDVRLTAP